MTLPLAVPRAALVIASAVAGASCICACGSGAAERASTSSQAIIGGAPDTSDTAVVALSDVANGDLCSGTLIAPSIVLTAAHCVDGVPAADLRVLVGNSTSSPDQTVSVTAAVPYPTYTSEANGILGGVDLGYVTLAIPLSITPMPIGLTTTDAQLTGASVTVVGFGVTSGTDDTGSGTRNSVSLAVSGVCSRLIQAGNATTNACVGDSGGAVLLGGKLVAVVSGGQLDCESPTNFMRTDAHANWIAGILATNGASDAGTCTSCVGPDPSCTAATETEPAGAGDDAGSSQVDGGNDDASNMTAASHGGCSTGTGHSNKSPLWPLFLALCAWVVTCRRTPRS